MCPVTSTLPSRSPGRAPRTTNPASGIARRHQHPAAGADADDRRVDAECRYVQGNRRSLAGSESISGFCVLPEPFLRDDDESRDPRGVQGRDISPRCLTQRQRQSRGGDQGSGQEQEEPQPWLLLLGIATPGGHSACDLHVPAGPRPSSAPHRTRPEPSPGASSSIRAPRAQVLHPRPREPRVPLQALPAPPNGPALAPRAVAWAPATTVPPDPGPGPAPGPGGVVPPELRRSPACTGRLVTWMFAAHSIRRPPSHRRVPGSG